MGSGSDRMRASSRRAATAETVGSSPLRNTAGLGRGTSGTSILTPLQMSNPALYLMGESGFHRLLSIRMIVLRNRYEGT